MNDQWFNGDNAVLFYINIIFFWKKKKIVDAFKVVRLGYPLSLYFTIWGRYVTKTSGNKQ